MSRLAKPDGLHTMTSPCVLITGCSSGIGAALRANSMPAVPWFMPPHAAPSPWLR